MVLAVSDVRGAAGATSGSPRQGETMSDTDKSVDAAAGDSGGKANLTPKTSASNLSERRNATIGELPAVSAFAAQHHSETARQHDNKKPPTIKYNPPTPQQGDFVVFFAARHEKHRAVNGAHARIV